MWNREELEAQAFVQRYLINEDYPLKFSHIAQAVEKKLDIEVDMFKLPIEKGVTAQLIVGREHALIYCNSEHSLEEQRFGLAHEFGHLLLDHRGGILQPGIGESERENKEADNFASALLMPIWKVCNLTKKYPDSLVFLVTQLSSNCGVTLEAAGRRLAAIDCLPGLWALIDPALGRIEWEYHSPSIHLDHDAFREFLVRQLRLSSKRRETDLNIMGYPFRVECTRMWDKQLVTCLPFTMPMPLAARETAAGYGGK